MQSTIPRSVKEILVHYILLVTCRPVLAFRHQQQRFEQQPGESWPPGGWPPAPPPGPLQDTSVPTLEPQPHKLPPEDMDYKDHWHPDVYRQFATRYESKPLDHANLLHPENRQAYEEFLDDHPRHPTYPNSVDRSAESLVIMTFALVGLSLIFAIIMVIDRLQARHLSSKSVTFGALTLVFAPWLLLWTWVLLVIVSNADEPTRGHGDQFHWACPLMLVYLGLFLVIHTVNVVVQVYAEWHSFFPKTEGRMGQMLQKIENKFEEAEESHPKWVKPVRTTFFALDVLIALIGIWLVYFSGSHRDFCQPALWWTSAVVAFVTGGAFLAAAVMYGCWRCVGALAVRSSGRDGLAFFRVLYYGASAADHAGDRWDATFIPAREPAAETIEVKSQPKLVKSALHPERKLYHAETQPTFAKEHRPKLQHAKTSDLAGEWTPEAQSISRM